ncbi:MAG TPA: glycosyltransferase family 9 protein [Candidatus Polarisedimenticolaceae bacterium]|nr:glycosyltransferase family 9 protein [Candidatus Polarisedimenticolaceae bacterium]
MLGIRALDERLREGGRGLTVLVIRLGAMGDIVRTLPAVRLVRFALPDARICWVAWEPWTEIIEANEEIDEVVHLPRGRLRRLVRSPGGWPGAANLTRELLGRVRGLHADLVLDFHGDLRAGLIGRWSGADVRLGYAGHQQKEGNRLFTTHRVPPGDRRTPRMERNLDLVRALGFPVRPVPDAGLSIPRSDARAAADIAAALPGAPRPYAVLGPGASVRQAYKKPPAALFAAAAAALERSGVVPVVAAGPGEEDDARAVAAAAGGRVSIAPATSLLTLAALLRGAKLFVGGDTGPLHLACGVGCPVVGLYGPTDPLVNSPWNVPFAALSPPGRTYTGIKAKDRVAGGFDGLAPEVVGPAVGEVLAVRA